MAQDAAIKWMTLVGFNKKLEVKDGHKLLSWY